VHLDQPVFIRHGTVDDKEDEVVIVVELRPLTKVLGVLEGERMELEDITEYGEVLILWCREVDPEEAAACEQPLEIVPNEVQFANLFFMYYMAG
jgi:hypothetical protein